MLPTHLLTDRAHSADTMDSVCAQKFHKEFAVNAVPYRPPVLVDPHAPVPFVILARARTGSNLLVHTLWQHPRVRCEGEALHPEEAYASPPFNWTVPERDAHRLEYIDGLLSATQWPPGSPRAKIGDAPVSSGFKAFAHHLSPSEFIGLSSSPMVRKIVLRRSNLLDEYLSSVKARVTGAYLHEDTSTLQVKIEPSDFFSFLHGIEVEDRCIDAARRHSTDRFGGDDWLTIYYEEMVDKDTMGDVMQRALNHILPVALRKAATGRPKESLSKQDTSRRNESITNLAQLCTVLRPMPRYFAMLVDGLDAASACHE
jgi:hypothetical protein